MTTRLPDYERLFAECVPTISRLPEAHAIVDRMNSHQSVYESIVVDVPLPKLGYAAPPWMLLALIHEMECGGDFTKTIKNGSPLPPDVFFAQDAINLLRAHGAGYARDWSLVPFLYWLEKWNGLGYIMYHPNVNTPYLWAASNLYVKGKYVQDGAFITDAVSQQIGAAVLLKIRGQFE